MRVLVAEDETLIRLDLKGLLEAAGLEVCAEARDGEEAVAMARESEPDVALLDVKMPKLDGIEAARRILEERPIPIVMVTAYGERELVARAVEAGVFGYLVKPFRESDVLPAIATATARHEELRALRDEADSLAEALAARKAIERAKGILVQREGLTEDEAFARLRKASQISGRPLKVVAEALIATLGASSDTSGSTLDVHHSYPCREWTCPERLTRLGLLSRGRYRRVPSSSHARLVDARGRARTGGHVERRSADRAVFLRVHRGLEQQQGARGLQRDRCARESRHRCVRRPDVLQRLRYRGPDDRAHRNRRRG